MNPSRWQKVRDVFDKARRREPPGMDSLLAALWGGAEESAEEIKEQLHTGTPPAFQAGDSVAGYRMIRKLGEGGFGQVFAAAREDNTAVFAIKIIGGHALFETADRKRFLREARLTGKLQHPNIVRVLEVIEQEHLAAIVMELVDGQPLTAHIPPGGMDFSLIERTATGICSALAAAHSQGIVHRDLKPANVMIDNTGLTRVLDFGAAKELYRDPENEVTAASTARGLVIGTPVYMSPEQVRGERVTVQSDIFSFGSLLYEMITGRAPFKRKSTLATMSAILREEPAPVARGDVPQHLLHVVEQCLVKDVAKRLANIDEARVRLAGI